MGIGVTLPIKTGGYVVKNPVFMRPRMGDLFYFYTGRR